MLVLCVKYEEVKVLVVQFVVVYVLGDLVQEIMCLGLFILVVQCDCVLGYICKGLEEGVEFIIGGVDMLEGLFIGFFVKLMVFGNVKMIDIVVCEEIFGFVFIVICYDDEEEVVCIVNDSIYGLGGGVWLGDEVWVICVVWCICMGQVNINGGLFNMQVLFGGYKQFGYGCENGKYGLEEFLEYKVMQFNFVKMV